MKKLMTIVVVMVLGFAIMPNVHASGEWLGDVESSTGGDTLKSGVLPVVSGSGTENVEMTYDNVELKYVPQDGDKPIDAAWVGMKVKAPKEVSSETLAQKVTYYRVGEEGNVKQFSALKDGGTGGEDDPFYIYIYVAVTEDKLKEAASKGIETLNLGTWVFKWDEAGEHTQNITIKINTSSVTLKGISDEVLLTPEETQQLIEESKKTPSTEQTEKPAEQPEEKNADTSDIDLGLLISLIAISTLGLAYTFRKRFN